MNTQTKLFWSQDLGAFLTAPTGRWKAAGRKCTHLAPRGMVRWSHRHRHRDHQRGCGHVVQGLPGSRGTLPVALRPQHLSWWLAKLHATHLHTEKSQPFIRDTIGREQGAPPEQQSPDSWPPARLPAGGRLHPEMNGSFAPLHLRLLLPSR